MMDDTKVRKVGKLVLNPNEDGAAMGDDLNEPDFINNLHNVLPGNFSAERHNDPPPWVNTDDYDFESAIKIPYRHAGKDRVIWIIYGSGGK
jgi:hypothetical protein